MPGIPMPFPAARGRAGYTILHQKPIIIGAHLWSPAIMLYHQPTLNIFRHEFAQINYAL
jgi:hypothetical protein